jgi:hypothetical protein
MQIRIAHQLSALIDQRAAEMPLIRRHRPEKSASSAGNVKMACG